MKRKHRKPAGDAEREWDLSQPAANSAGELQFGPRSPESDPERLSHLAITVFDVDGYSAHIAGQNAPPMRLRPYRPDRGIRIKDDDGIPPPHLRGTPWETIERKDADIASVERECDKAMKRAPRFIDEPEKPEHRLANRLGFLSPMRRFLALGGRSVIPERQPRVPRCLAYGW